MSNTSHSAWRCSVRGMQTIYMTVAIADTHSHFILILSPWMGSEGINHLHLPKVSPLRLGRTPTCTLVLGELCGVLINTWVRQATSAGTGMYQCPPHSLCPSERNQWDWLQPTGWLFGNQSPILPRIWQTWLDPNTVLKVIFSLLLWGTMLTKSSEIRPWWGVNHGGKFCPEYVQAYSSVPRALMPLVCSPSAGEILIILKYRLYFNLGVTGPPDQEVAGIEREFVTQSSWEEWAHHTTGRGRWGGEMWAAAFCVVLRREGMGQYACLGLASLSHFKGPSSVGAVPPCLVPGPEAFRDGS